MDDTKRPSVRCIWICLAGAILMEDMFDAQLNTGINHVTKIRTEVYRTDVRAEMTMYPEEK